MYNYSSTAELPSTAKDLSITSLEQKTWQRIHGITLTQKDRDDILSGEWLNDSIINAAQFLLRHDPALLPVGSLQNTLLIKICQCDIICDESVQILHSGGNHWITISTVGQSAVGQSAVGQSAVGQSAVGQSAEQLTVKIYNSLDNELPQETKEQVAALLNTDIAFDPRPVQVNLL